MKEFWKSEGLGILFTAALGSFGHFAYDLSKENILVALFCPVNESTWEHLKLLFFPFLLFSLLRLFFSEKNPLFLPPPYFQVWPQAFFLFPKLFMPFCLCLDSTLSPQISQSFYFPWFFPSPSAIWCNFGKPPALTA